MSTIPPLYWYDDEMETIIPPGGPLKAIQVVALLFRVDFESM